MAITYNLAPIPRWFFTDQFGAPLSGGSLFSYRDSNRSQYKPIYMDINGAFPYPDPIVFDMNGMAPGIFYFASDEYYFLKVFDATIPIPVEQFSVPMYNAPGFGGPTPPTPTNTFPNNLARNPQFTFWSTSPTWINYSQPINSVDYVSDDWVYNKDNNNPTVNITRQPFPLGQIDVPGSPVYFFDYECTSAGAGGLTINNLSQSYASVQTLAGQTVTISFWAKTNSIGSVSVNFQQFFGTGGSPTASVNTLALAVPTLTSIWTLYSATVTLPTIAGATIGTNGDDALILQFNFPLNQPASVNLVNVYPETGSVVSPFPYETVDGQEKNTDYNITQSLWYTGDVKSTFRAVADPGWLMLDNGTLGSTFSIATHTGPFIKGLYILLWNSVSDTWCPVSGGRGMSAEADYDANKTIGLPNTIGRVLAQADGVTNLLASFLGETTHTLTIPEIPSHSHQYALPTSILSTFASGSSYFIQTSLVNTTATGGDGPHNNMQPTVFVNYMIKL